MSLLKNIYLGVFATLFMSFFFLRDKMLLKNFILSIIKKDNHDKTKKALRNAKYLLSRYFIGIMIQISCITFLVTMGLTGLEVENAIIIGFFAGIINIIPYIGPMIGGFCWAYFKHNNNKPVSRIISTICHKGYNCFCNYTNYR